MTEAIIIECKQSLFRIVGAGKKEPSGSEQRRRREKEGLLVFRFAMCSDNSAHQAINQVYNKNPFFSVSSYPGQFMCGHAESVIKQVNFHLVYTVHW